MVKAPQRYWQQVVGSLVPQIKVFGPSCEERQKKGDQRGWLSSSARTQKECAGNLGCKIIVQIRGLMAPWVTRHKTRQRKQTQVNTRSLGHEQNDRTDREILIESYYVCHQIPPTHKYLCQMGRFGPVRLERYPLLKTIFMFRLFFPDLQIKLSANEEQQEGGPQDEI